jgi:hypothetical protein
MAGKMIKKKKSLFYTPPPSLKAWFPHQFFFVPQNCGDFHDGGIKSSCRKCFVVFLIMGYYNFAFHLGDKFDMIVVRLPNQKKKKKKGSFVKMLVVVLLSLVATGKKKQKKTKKILQNC